MSGAESAPELRRGHWKLMWRYLGRQRLAFVALFVLLFAETGLELLAPQIIRVFIDQLGANAPARTLVRAALLFLAITAARLGFRVVRTVANGHVAWTATNGLRVDLARHVVGLDLSFHTTHTPGELLERVDGDVGRLTTFFSDLLPGIVGGVLLSAGVLVALCFDDWRLSAVLGVFLCAFAALHRWDQRWAVPHWRQERQCATDVSSFVQERVGGVPDIHTVGATPHTMRSFLGLLRAHARRSVKAEIVTDASWAASNGFYAIGVAVAMGVCVSLFTRDAITLGAVYLVVHYLQTLHRPISRIGRNIEDLLRSRVAIERIHDLLTTPSDLRDDGTRLCGGVGPAQVSIGEVWFGYGSDSPVLEGVSLSISPGETLGLLGRTGSGKTTLSRLLYRFYDPERGTILLDGIDIRDLELSELRRRVAVVTQEVQLFRGSVRDNVTLFRPDISDQQVLEALQQLGLGAWLEGLSQGIDTLVSWDAAGLSAGQAQLLAVARAFVQDPGLVVLDEASSRLDPSTEEMLENAIDRLLLGRTAVVIAHRPSTVRRADTIMLLDRGRVKEYGRYSDLAANPDSAFAELLRAGAGEVLT